MDKAEVKVIQPNPRLLFLDVARGISMICIVLGHLGEPSYNRVVFTFHLPVFFLLSGYFIDTKRSWKLFLKRKFRTLIVPYYFSCLLILVSSLVITGVVTHEPYTGSNFVRFIKSVIYASGDSWTEPFEIPGIGAIWFLWATFFGCIILRLVLELKPWLQVPIVFAVFVIGKLTVDHFFLLPLGIQPACCALLFMYIGYLVKNSEQILRSPPKVSKLFAIVFAAWIWISFIKNFQSFWLVHCDIGRGVIDIFGSICASGIVFFISWILAKYVKLVGKALAFLGKYSIIFSLCAYHRVEYISIFRLDYTDSRK